MENLNDKIKKVLALVKEYANTTTGVDQDISQAKALTTQSSERDFIKAVGLDPKTFFRIYRTLHEILYNKDGSLTKFARQHQIVDFNKFYGFLRDKVKPLIKNDHLVEAFELIREMYMVAYPKVLAKGLVEDPVYAVNFVARTIYYVLDNLRILQKVFKIMNYMEQSPEFKSTMLALEKKFGA
jgi:hypothetical protein